MSKASKVVKLRSNISKHKVHNFTQGIEQNRLIFRLHYHQINVNFFAVEEFRKNDVIVMLCYSIGETTSHLNEGLERTIQKFVNLSIIIVIVSYSEDALNVIPYGSTEF